MSDSDADDGGNLIDVEDAGYDEFLLDSDDEDETKVRTSRCAVAWLRLLAATWMICPVLLGAPSHALNAPAKCPCCCPALSRAYVWP